MRCYGVPIEGKTVCIDNAFTVFVPYGSVYYLGNSSADDKNDKGFVKILDNKPSSYRDGLISISDDADGTTFKFTLAKDSSDAKISKVIENRHKIFANADKITNRQELYSDSTTVVIRAHIETETSETTNLGGGLMQIATQKWTIYSAAIVCPKGIYSCFCDNFGFGIFSVDDTICDKLLSSIRSAKPETAEEKVERITKERKTEEERRKKAEEEVKRKEEERKKREEAKKAEKERKDKAFKLENQRDAISHIQNMLCVNNNAIAVVTLEGKVLTSGLPDNLKRTVEKWKDIKQIAMTISPEMDTTYVVGLKTNGTVVFAGKNADNQMNLSAWNDIVQISCGYRNVYGIDKNGKAYAAGDSSADQLNVSSWSGVLKVIGSVKRAVGLKADGTVVSSGMNYYGDTVRKFRGNVADITYGSSKLVGAIYVLTEDGKVVSPWGDEDDVSKWEDIISISEGFEKWAEILAVSSDGKVLASLRSEGRDKHTDVLGWNNIAYVAGSGDTIAAITVDGYVKVSSNVIASSEFDNLRLFNNYLTLEADRLQQIKDAEEKRIREIKNKISDLEKELLEVKGIFAGSKKKKLHSQIDELKKSL